MSGRADAAAAADQRRVNRAAVRAGVWVGVAAAAVVAIVTTATVAVMITASRPDRRPPPPGGGRRSRVIELDLIVPVTVVLGILGALALAVLAGYAARRAAAPLAEALRVQRTFVADAGHELRTPLTTLSSRIQLAQHRAAQGGDVSGALAELRRDADAMDTALTDLLITAETAGVGRDDRTAVTTVAEAAADATAVIGPRAAERGIRIVVDARDAPAVTATRAALSRALIALLDNAVRHSPAGGTVTVRAAADGRRVRIAVADEGSGVTGVDPDRLFDRFARSTAPAPAPGEGRSRGFGLGLALVRDIAVRFGGEVRLESTSPRGSVFVLELPTAGRLHRRT
ncbi:HAMP domain-containing histidine kinase [Microbacterium sp. zg.Y1090]|uniref:sensor histidine kinase n=1 Tax=Microbacterium wangruii TaxID=3049073 RepID=UPI00214B7DEF|nr:MULTISPECIES: HAMP domain-containing sensor histidine kinase [unclassified Microbacterium]MCR2817517.1 HAMP domain-containing histidine kinase [Microbacterium sp. zg.Y1090]WIM29000.1 HAMP domain-containing sensor histidine kinase [Microbacterium sp. zg-Y1090]